MRYLMIFAAVVASLGARAQTSSTAVTGQPYCPIGLTCATTICTRPSCLSGAMHEFVRLVVLGADQRRLSDVALFPEDASCERERKVLMSRSDSTFLCVPSWRWMR